MTRAARLLTRCALLSASAGLSGLAGGAAAVSAAGSAAEAVNRRLAGLAARALLEVGRLNVDEDRR